LSNWNGIIITVYCEKPKNIVALYSKEVANEGGVAKFPNNIRA